MGRQILVQWTTQYFSLYQDCHHIPAAVCLQHRDQRVSLINPENLGTLSDLVTTRSDQHTCGKPMLTDPDKQATANREPADETNREDLTQGILVWLHPFTVDQEDLETHVLAHSCKRENSDSEGDASKVETQKRNHSVHAYFRKKTKEICSANRKVWRLDNSRA